MNTQETLAKLEKAITEEVETKKYIFVKKRMQTLNGKAFIINRAVYLLTNENFDLSGAVASIESELEGMD